MNKYTGWTRAELVELADRSLLALRPWATPGHARFDLPGAAGQSGPIVDGLEAFARSFLAVGFRLSAADSDPHDHASWYAHGLIAGTDRAGAAERGGGADRTGRAELGARAERWPSLVDTPQARVEAAAIAIGLHESRRWIWDALPSSAQERIVEWLAGSVGAWYPESNWQWFHNVTHAFLRSVGGPHDQAKVDEYLEYLDSCYLDEGWYTDGRGGNVDWYAGFVMQLFSLWYCRMSGDHERQLRYAARLKAYVASAADLFGADGAPLYQGRSLVYRHAVVGALWTAAVFDASPLPPGRLRRTCLGAIKYFVDRGAYDEHGLLSQGWHDRFEPMRQSYSGPGSPYWASLGLAGLVLPESHPVWTEPEEPAPIDVGDHVHAIRPIGWIVSGTASDGIVRVTNHRAETPDGENQLYSRFAYSTVTAPVPLPSGAADQAVDNQVAVIDTHGRWSQRPHIKLQVINTHRAESQHVATFAKPSEPGPTLTCVSLVRGAVEVRAVRVEPGGSCVALVVSGYAVPRRPAPGARVGLVSGVTALTGGGRTGHSVHLLASPFGAELEVPWCRFDSPAADQWYVVAVCLGGSTPTWPIFDADQAKVCWPDGSVDEL
ncbi:DUF2264 domain-containing protein [Kribbella solani]|uniref:DUF2264 domain-containing protein n=1 Tax=Kribbella solani TaxID=236067 RepID=A0A841DFW6_9ACTN|nr:hypothetical protein [Kribbella solani]